MTEGLAHAFGPTVRVNTLMCGPFATWATRHWQDDPEALAAGVRDHALQRIGDPREVVGAALYLMSDAASYTTGATLRVDGGCPETSVSAETLRQPSETAATSAPGPAEGAAPAKSHAVRADAGASGPVHRLVVRSQQRAARDSGGASPLRRKRIARASGWRSQWHVDVQRRAARHQPGVSGSALDTVDEMHGIRRGGGCGA